MKRIGIYSGTFDPVHAGHISFALQSLQAGQLDTVYFLPERRPRAKTGVEHYGHRVAMLKQATRPHRRLRVLETEEISFRPNTTLARLKRRFPRTQLVFLVGSDVVSGMPYWPNIEQLLKGNELLIGMRSADSYALVQESIARWPQQPLNVTVIESYAPSVSSRGIREALRARSSAPGLLRSVERYSNRNWLYVSVV